MPDLLAHALIAYSLARLLSWRLDWLSPAYVTVAMMGAFVPDLAKISLLVPRSTVSTALGVPFHWFALHTLGGCLLSIAVGIVLVAPSERGRVAALLSLGAGSHLLADSFVITLPNRAFSVLWPVSNLDPGFPELYHSTDPLPMLVAAVVALLVTILTRAREERTR